MGVRENRVRVGIKRFNAQAQDLLDREFGADHLLVFESGGVAKLLTHLDR